MLRVGQKVACISGFTMPLKYQDEILPEVGEVYTISEIVDLPEGLGLRLVEIVNKPHQYSIGLCECCFAASAFRPVVETNIEIFTAMLTDERLPQRVF